jgi:hypothetical protein
MTAQTSILMFLVRADLHRIVVEVEPFMSEYPMCRELAEQVTTIPDRFEVSDKSTARLLRDTGFLERRQDLSVEEVADVLRKSPKLADKWLKRGSEQRLAGGWGIEHEGSTYRIQNFGDGSAEIEQDRFRACAVFIVRYVHFIGEVQGRQAH